MYKMLSQQEKTYLLKLARKAIEHYLENKAKLKVEEKNVPEKLLEKKGCFVTLTSNSMLRGCIGHLLPVQPLYKDVIENAVNAGFYDPRFPPLVKEELKQTHIEISVLDIPKKLEYKDEKDLIQKLTKSKPGVILKKGFYHATFLPQVWDEISDAEEFLGHLCMKAGLMQDEWKTGILTIETYEVEKFEE